ncbi:MAG TPA: hypothetical protein VGN07_00565 [Steroidobacteraceae bacterium]
MATKDDTSKVRSGRNSSAKRSAKNPPKRAKASSTFKALEDIVEEERARLMKAHSILDCVIRAMEDEEGASGNDGPYWPAVIESARDLINESIQKLEDLDYGPAPASSTYEVREPLLTYGAAVSPDVSAAHVPIDKSKLN